MAKTTMTERIVAVETKLVGLTDQIKDHCVDNKSDLHALFSKLDNIEQGMETKFAGKWVEKVAIGVIVSIIIAVLTIAIKTGTI